jgi:hypothetical protein
MALNDDVEHSTRLSFGRLDIKSNAKQSLTDFRQW